MRALCDLGTDEAAREIVHRLRDDGRHYLLYMIGLIRSPNRTAGLREMDQLLQAPDFPVTLKELFW